MKYILFLLIILTNNLASANQSSYTKIIAYNPYRLAVELEVKCDYNNKTKKFRFHKIFLIGGKSDTTIKVPNTLKQCQIWPKVYFWGR